MKAGKTTEAPAPSWTAVASEARHRFGLPRSGSDTPVPRSAGTESAVAAALCRRTPKSRSPFAERGEKVAGGRMRGFLRVGDDVRSLASNADCRVRNAEPSQSLLTSAPNSQSNPSPRPSPLATQWENISATRLDPRRRSDQLIVRCPSKPANGRSAVFTPHRHRRRPTGASQKI